MEKKVQDKVIRTAKKCGFVVYKLKPGPGIPKGTLDLLMLKGPWWGVVECKAYPDSKWQTLQEHTFDLLGSWSWARVAHSENVDDICKEIESIA